MDTTTETPARWHVRGHSGPCTLTAPCEECQENLDHHLQDTDHTRCLARDCEDALTPDVRCEECDRPAGVRCALDCQADQALRYTL